VIREDELVTAHADDDVFRAHGGPDALCNGLQQLVARLVAPRVVDVLEAVEVEEQHRQHRARPPRVVDRAGQMCGEEQAVRQARELVVVSEMIEMLLLLEKLRLHLAAYRDVVGREGQHRAPAQLQAVTADLDIDQAAVLAALTDPDRMPVGAVELQVVRRRPTLRCLESVASRALCLEADDALAAALDARPCS
jgi:hypothetical protein